MTGISERAAQWGIETEYWDAYGRRCIVGPEVVERLVEVLSVAGDEAARIAPKTIVLRQGSSHSRLALNAPDHSTIRWQISLDQGTISGEGVSPSIALPDNLPVGTFRLHIALTSAEGTQAEECAVLVAPPRAYQGENPSSRLWVLAVQLYGVRSRHNWGHGDFADLGRLIALSAEQGAAGIGLNPLHALFDDHAEGASPYSPSSRLFLNPLYIDVEAVPEFPGVEAAGLQDALADLRSRDIVDYDGVAAAKAHALKLAYDVFCQRKDAQRQQDFEQFRAERGSVLTRFAAFELMRRRLQRPWWEWPAEWRTPDDATIAGLCQTEREAVEFFEFVQWLADQQLEQCRLHGRKLGLPIGLYLDLAVGVRPDGFDAWDDQDSYLAALTVGAPPDALNAAGQDWGLLGLNPASLETQRFEPFRRMLRSAMRYAGAIRLDHVLGLKRLYLIPKGVPADQGAYVQFPFEALLAVTAQESVEQKCIVIGEDLGTVPEHFRETLADWGVWSYQVMMFERSPEGEFHPPESYRQNALVTFNTHDLPTFTGWMTNHDLQEKKRLGLEPGETEEERKNAQGALRQALRAGDSCDFSAAAEYLAATPARLLAVSAEDILGVKDQPNIPGTTDQHPNWRRRLPVGLEEWKNTEALSRVARIMAAASRNFR
jgi:4-alpha-glucanotransferase